MNCRIHMLKHKLTSDKTVQSQNRCKQTDLCMTRKPTLLQHQESCKNHAGTFAFNRTSNTGWAKITDVNQFSCT